MNQPNKQKPFTFAQTAFMMMIIMGILGVASILYVLDTTTRDILTRIENKETTMTDVTRIDKALVPTLKAGAIIPTTTVLGDTTITIEPNMALTESGEFLLTMTKDAVPSRYVWTVNEETLALLKEAIIKHEEVNAK